MRSKHSKAGLSRPMTIALGSGGALAGLLIIVLTWGTGWGWVGAGLVSFSPMLAVQLMRLKEGDKLRPAVRHFRNRLSAVMVAYFVILMGAVTLYKQGLTEGPVGYLVALAPAIPILAVFIILGRLLREENDEFLRDVMRTSLVWSGALTLCEATVWGFLEMFAKAPHAALWMVPIAFFAQLGLTGPLAARRYR